ncbi:hypothetical protein [uncultured Thiodictyon sp.]|uniref:hypothetical protein n=1 Tax=uncultured Thiodictyon sp. TaxID=1846217 RepID=UPI0025F67BC6|nr:hypothetical protein [uncultured Thiodictyon sp.]
MATLSKKQHAALDRIDALTAGDYIKLLDANPPTDRQWAMLKFHHASPKHTATARELANGAGYTLPQAATLQYGIFAGKYCSQLKIAPPNKIALFVTFLKPKLSECKLIMRPALIKALNMMIQAKNKGG